MQEVSLGLQSLLNSDGELIEKGRFKNIKYNFNRNDSKLSLDKTKEEDLYVIYNHFNAFVISISRASKYVFTTVALIDLLAPWARTREIKMSLGKGDNPMPGNPCDGDIVFKTDNNTVIIKSNEHGKRIMCHIDDFNDGVPIDADISIIDEPDECISTTDIYKGNIKNYKYSSKINCMSTHGIVRFKNKEYLFKPDNSFSNLHWYRGFNNHNKDYYNAFASGFLGSGRVGFNIGIDLDKDDYDTENILLSNNSISYLEKCSLEINKKHAKQIQQSKWTVKGASEQIDLVFTPIIDISYDNRLLKRNIIFGIYNGKVNSESDNYQLEHFTGCIIRDK